MGSKPIHEFELTYRNLAALRRRIELVHGDYARLVDQCLVADDRGVVAFIAPPWGTALDEMQGLDLERTFPPISRIIVHLERRFSKHKMLFAIQVYEKVSAPSLSKIRAMLDWSECRIYDINEKGSNHGILVGAKRWAPTR